MRKRYELMIAPAVAACFLVCMGLVAPASARVDVIFDTDMSTDCDDVGALAILNKLADNGEARILACLSNGSSPDKAIAASIDVINTYYGRPSIPIGTYQGRDPQPPASRSLPLYGAQLRDEFPHTALPDDREPKALDVYRGSLAAAADQSVTIVSVGYLVNLEDLLRSTADSHSPLGGRSLIRAKVKRLVVMGGGYPSNWGENNFAANGAGVHTQYVIRHWPAEVPILFSGAEIGGNIYTGTHLGSNPANSPVRRAYEIYTQFHGRPSWDLTAVLAAVRDPTRYWKEIATGHNEVESSGKNEWVPGADVGQAYLVSTGYDVGPVLDDLLDALPSKSVALQNR